MEKKENYPIEAVLFVFCFIQEAEDMEQQFHYKLPFHEK